MKKNGLSKRQESTVTNLASKSLRTSINGQWKTRGRGAGIAALAAIFLNVASAGAQALSPSKYGPDNWVAIGDGIRGTDGEVITIVPDGFGNFYVGGDFTVIGDVLANGIAKWDGHAWSPLGLGMDGRVRAIAVSGANIYAGGQFKNAGGMEAQGVARWDGENWSPLGSGFPGVSVDNAPFIIDLAILNGDLYVGGQFSEAGGVAANNITKWNGAEWSALGDGADNLVRDLEVVDNDLYICGRFKKAGGIDAEGVAKWDGSTWSPLGSGIVVGGNNQVFELQMVGTDLYAGGFFFAKNGSPADYVAKWDGTSWSALGSGIVATGIGNNDLDQVLSLAAVGDDLYVGGRFSIAGGVAVDNIAKWDGNAWSALGSDPGLTYENRASRPWVETLAVSGGSLYAGGTFKEAGGEVANSIAQWDGTHWSGLGSDTFTDLGITPAVVEVAGADIYVGHSRGIMKWDGTVWSNLGTNLENGPTFSFNPGIIDYPFRSIEVSGSDVFTYGSFETVEGASSSHIVKWDGSSWSALGGALDAYPIILKTAGTDLYAGGVFTEVGGAVVNHIAKWDGSQWSALGDGVDGVVEDILISGTDVYVSGRFTHAGGIPANHVAKWDGAQWSSLGAGVDILGAGQIIMWKSNLYAAGVVNDPFATGTEVTGMVARWDGASWTVIAGPESPDSETSPIGMVPTFTSAGEYLSVVSYINDPLCRDS